MTSERRMRQNLTSGSMRGSRGGSLGRYGETDYALHPRGGRQGSSTPGTVGGQPILFSTLHTDSASSLNSYTSENLLTKGAATYILHCVRGELDFNRWIVM